MLKIDWYDNYSNNPHFLLEEDLRIADRGTSEFEKLGDGLWVHEQSNGIVQYFAHSGSDRNEGGYGGSIFECLVGGEVRRFAGPWSSRASCVNMYRDRPIVDVRLITNPYAVSTAITLEALLERWDYEFYLVQAGPDKTGEKGPIVPSLAPDCILKRNGMIIESYGHEGIELIAEKR